MRPLLLTILICLISLTSFAQEETVSPIKNIAPELQIKEEDFTYEEYQRCLKGIKDTLEQYYRGEDPGWEIENIGVPNRLIVLQGYGLISQRDTIRLKLENAKLKGTEEEIADLEKALDETEREIKSFLSENIWVD